MDTTELSDQIVVTKFEVWSPEKAQETLDYSSKQGFTNRIETKHGDTRGIQYYAKQMKTGKWNSKNGETIKLTSDGILIDGYHRLKAIILSNTTLELLTVRGVTKESYQDIDRGVPRKLSDIVFQAGITSPKYSRILTPAAQALHFLLAENRRSPTGSNKKVLFVSDVDRVVRNHPYILDASEKYSTVFKRHTIISQSNFCIIYTLLHEIDVEKADLFLNRVQDGLGLTENDPRYALREKLLKTRSNRRGANTNYRDELCYIIKAWNCYYFGKSLVKLCLSDDLPMIAGFTYHPGDYFYQE